MPNLSNPEQLRGRLFFGPALAVLGEALFLSAAVPSFNGKIIGLVMVSLGITFLWAAWRKPPPYERSKAPMYPWPTLVLSWLCVVLGVGVIVQRVMTGDYVLGSLLGLVGMTVGLRGIVMSKSGE